MAGTISAEEFHVLRLGTDEWIELWAGRIVEPAPCSANGGLISTNLVSLCGNALRGSGCRVLGRGACIVIDPADTFYHAYATISCPPDFAHRDRGTLLNPTVVIEILPWGIQNHAEVRTTKFDGYATLPSVQEIVLIDSQRVRVEVYERREDGWLLRIHLPGSVARLASVSVSLPLDELYEDTSFEDEA